MFEDVQFRVSRKTTMRALFARPAVAALSLGLLLGEKLEGYLTGTIHHDENVILFPTLAHQSNATHWEVPLHGWIFEPELDDKKRKAFVAILRQAIGSTDKDFLNRRLWPFLVDNERWKRPRISLLGETYRPNLSGKNGHFYRNISVSIDSTKHLSDGILPMESLAKDGRKFEGRAHLIPPQGISVISDIDDTIKITNVTDKSAMMKNTFTKTFEPVPGMAALYQRWEQESDARFHFVSATPFQLYSELENFRKKCNFPMATYHLKTIRPKGKSVFRLIADPFKYKTTMLMSILDRFPKRQFVLVGDSGEKDPEVYGHIARLYPEQIRKIYIRKVVLGEDATKRGREAFARVDPSKWYFYDDASELSSLKLSADINS